jgi:hypothetical protein
MPLHRRQEAVWMCGTGDLEACNVMYRFELAGETGSNPLATSGR